MKQNVLLLALASLVCAALTASAATRYVNLNNPTPAPPYTNWPTAATNIQDAVDIAAAGDEILVTNGAYQTGAREMYGSNRVAVTKPVTVRSVNGPAFTQIVGYQVPGSTYGLAAVRCVYLTNAAVLAGFTLNSGATQVNSDGPAFRTNSGGGVLCEGLSAMVSNCVLMGNWALSGGGAYSGTLNNCTVTNNSSGSYGGGASGSTLNHCTLSDNSATWGGGGAYEGMLNHCTLTGNQATIGSGAAGATLNHCTLSRNFAAMGIGGGASDCSLYNCTLSGNAADDGGGAYSSTLNNCTLMGNSAWWWGGGGASKSTLYDCTLRDNFTMQFNTGGGGGAIDCWLGNCTLIGNQAAGGGGAASSTLNNCTLAGNSAIWGSGGGASNCLLTNCIVYYNNAGGENGNDYESAFSHCCTTPLPAGPGNSDSEPLFVDTNGWSDLRLQSNSPCINAGRNTYVTNFADLDGNPRIVNGTVDIGAYEYQGPGSTISYAWLQQFDLPTDGSADTADPDSDGLNNWQEWRCATDPTNALSALRLLSAAPSGTNVVLTWKSVAGVSYAVERSTNLGAVPTFSLLRSNLPGRPSTTTWTDTNALRSPPGFYRVRVGN